METCDDFLDVGPRSATHILRDLGQARHKPDRHDNLLMR